MELLHALRDGDQRISRDEIRATVAAQLGCAVAESADHDDLIQMGLNSIRMMALAGGWRKRGASITFAELAATPTVDSWHGLLCAGEADEMKSAAEPVVTLAHGESRVPSRSPRRPRSRWPPCSMRTG